MGMGAFFCANVYELVNQPIGSDMGSYMLNVSLNGHLISAHLLYPLPHSPAAPAPAQVNGRLALPIGSG